MRVRLGGTGGPLGWPVPGCRCASCGRVPPGHRRPASIVVGDRLRLAPAVAGAEPGHAVAATADGWTVTGPDGARLLYAPARDALPHAPGGEAAPPCDLVLLDVLDDPGRLGDLRRRGVVGERTPVVAVGADHRVGGEAELTRRLALWGVHAVPDGTVLRVRPGEVRVLAGGPGATEDPEATGEVLGGAGAPRPPRRTLLLGGSGSGKSAEAELRLAALPEVVYVATGPSGAGDPEWAERVRAHRERRPAHWRTVETADVAGLLGRAGPPLLVDGLGTWLAAVFDACGAWESRAGAAEAARRCDELVAAWRDTPRRVVAVSDEVGLGVVPATASGRAFRDALGRLNQRLAAESEEVALVVAGRLLPLP